MENHRAAEFYKGDASKVSCELCPHNCHLSPGQTGICKVRYHHEGTLRTKTYGQVSSLALDPIEKKPLYHFYPGTQILSVGSFGCNLSCPWCQNYHIACQVPSTRYVETDELVRLALDTRQENSIGIAYTYNEPTMAYEFVIDCAGQAKADGLKNVMVTNGYINPKPLNMLLEVIDAFNIDLKGFTAECYRHYCKGSAEPVWDSIEQAAARSHVEVTSLIIPELNDDPDDFRKAAYRLSQINPDMPWHLSAFYPAHRFQDRNATPASTLYRLRDIAREYMHYVYLGNLGPQDNNTVCYHCGHLLIKRTGYHTVIAGITDHCCSSCQQPVPILM